MELFVNPPGVFIRDAQLEDHEFILELVPELLTFSPPPSRDAQQMTTIDRQVISDTLQAHTPNATILVGKFDSGQPAEFIHLFEEKDYYGGACGHVGDVVVAPKARGQGIGKVLLSAGEQWALTRGYRLLTLNVFLANTTARAVYEEAGFQ